MQQAAKHVIFKGRVQGVGFRYTTHRIAQQYDMTGYVKNCPDGSVEALFQGTASNIQACIGQVEESFNGYIRETKINDRPVNPQYHEFQITY